ncbi:MAG: hypothetical protein AAF997_22020, partial [Myxococcota bacterium]
SNHPKAMGFSAEDRRLESRMLGVRSSAVPAIFRPDLVRFQLLTGRERVPEHGIEQEVRAK